MYSYFEFRIKARKYLKLTWTLKRNLYDGHIIILPDFDTLIVTLDVKETRFFICLYKHSSHWTNLLTG